MVNFFVLVIEYISNIQSLGSRLIIKYEKICKIHKSLHSIAILHCPFYFFFAFLYCMDIILTTILLLLFWTCQKEYTILMVIVTELLIHCRQTNSIWIFFLNINKYWEKNQSKFIISYLSINEYIQFYIHGWSLHLWNNLRTIIRQPFLYRIILMILVIFISINQGIVSSKFWYKSIEERNLSKLSYFHQYTYFFQVIKHIINSRFILVSYIIA
jgi:hypothetical protein